MLTVQEIQQAMPAQLKAHASQELADALNRISTDAEAARTIRENFITYTSVLQDGKFKLTDYIHAVCYVSYKLMGYTNRESYMRTFPVRHQKLMAAGRTDKEISSYVSAYNKNRLVNLVLEQSLIPTWILNQDAYQKAINTQVELMQGANSEMVRTQAANSILTHLKPPEKKEVELKVSTPDSSGLDALKQTLQDLALQQQELIRQGIDTRSIAHQKIIDVTPEEDAP